MNPCWRATKLLWRVRGIGATLRAAGFTINKKLLIKTEVPANEAFVALANGTTTLGTPLFTKVYALFAETSDSSMRLCSHCRSLPPGSLPASS